VRRFLVLGLLALSAGNASAQSKTGTTVGTFLRIEPDARIAAMGNAGVSQANGIASYYFNPASVAMLEKKELAFSHSAWIADIAYDHVAMAFPLGKKGTAAVSVTSLRSGDIDVRTVDQPLGTGELYHVSDFAAGLGWARPITDRFFSMNPSIIMLRFRPCSKITVFSFSNLIAARPSCPSRAPSSLGLATALRLWHPH